MGSNRASQGNSGDPNSGPPDDDGHNNSHNSNPGSVHMPVPKLEYEPKPKDTSRVLAKALT